MARFRRKKRRKQSRKMTGDSPNASLAAMAPIIEQKGIFDLIHQQVVIGQKTIDYRPTDKLVLVILSMLSGCQTINEINWKLRVDKALLLAFGYSCCPHQSVIQDTLDAAMEHNVEQLSGVTTSLFAQHNLFAKRFGSKSESKLLTIDFDLSAQPSSPNAQKAAKGYSPSGRKNLTHFAHSIELSGKVTETRRWQGFEGGMEHTEGDLRGGEQWSKALDRASKPIGKYPFGLVRQVNGQSSTLKLAVGRVKRLN